MAKKKQEPKNDGILNRDLLKFKQGFENLANIQAPVGFSYKIIKNLKLIQEELKVIDEVIQPSEDYNKVYQPEVEKLAKKFCKKDDKGNPIPRRAPNGATMYDFENADKIKFDKSLEDLEKKPEFKKLVDERKKQMEDYNELLDKEVTVSFIKIKQDELPDTISPAQLELIFELIE